MITPSAKRLQVREVSEDAWQWHLQHAIRDMAALGRALALKLPPQTSRFPLLVPRPYLSRIEPGNYADPLLLQVLPKPQEHDDVVGYSADPVGEVGLSGTPPGLLQKYQGRALITLTGACAVNCRYCFRREFPYEAHQPGAEGWQEIVQYLQQDDSIKEIIFSGGDPLVVSDRRLGNLLNAISDVSHIDTIRVHTRLPIVIPQRITEALMQNLTQTGKQVVMVLHTNHPNEIDGTVKTATSRLKSSGITLLNQSVLLKNVNDDFETLYRLSKTLFDAGVLPYYLHALDPVRGAAHFDVTDATGLALQKELQDNLPGYLVPRFVREVPGAGAKQWIHHA